MIKEKKKMVIDAGKYQYLLITGSRSAKANNTFNLIGLTIFFAHL